VCCAAYYVGEVLLYGQPLGVVLIVMAALASSFVIEPLESALGMVDQATPIYIVFLGLTGAILCVIERKATVQEQVLSFGALYTQFWRKCKRCVWSDAPAPAAAPRSASTSTSTSTSTDSSSLPAEVTTRLLPAAATDSVVAPAPATAAAAAAAAAPGAAEGVSVHLVAHASEAGADPELAVNRSPHSDDKAAAEAAARLTGVKGVLRTTVRVGLPFLVLALSYSMWFVTQKVFNNQFRTNAFGYTSLDQTLAPVYMLYANPTPYPTPYPYAYPLSLFALWLCL
jgi:hypothetical protein